MNELPATGDTVASRYEKLASHRAPFLERARLNALYTIPSLFPPEGHSGSSKLYKPSQSLGAYGTNNLASKLMLGLFPPNRPFYRLIPDAEVEEELDAESRKEIDSGLAKAERRILEQFTLMRVRPAMFRAFRNLIVGGNFLLWIRDGRALGYSLDQYVAVRSYAGDLRELILREILPEEDVDRLTANQKSMHGEVGPSSVSHADRGMEREDEVYLYTRFYKDGTIWRSYQEVAGEIVEGSEASYGKNRPPPVLALRWHSTDGEDYGRAFADDYVGDLAATEGLSKAMLRFAAVASKIIFLVASTGSTRPAELQKALSGDFVPGNAEDVTELSLANKAFDFQAANTVLGDTIERLRFAFLLNTAVQRNAERVTAEEIRQMMNELETAHGGTLSFFSDDIQLPLVDMLMSDMRRRKKLPELKRVQVTVITGIDALSRNQELMDMSEAFGVAAQLIGPEAIVAAVDTSEALRRVFVSKGIKIEGLLKSKEQKEQDQQQARQDALMQQAAGPAAKAVAESATAGEQ